ncbi:fumarate hydratase C-terminal domain-containing protein, partial [Escherichia coli]|uniref:fumarate hydratase C-terminal domain-containing protein n=1 Tax=Escherichia coli TaxID=562 RepID=UPI001951ECB1
DHPIYYAGPAKTPAGYPSGSLGPTTAGRMDSYVDLLQSHGGSYTFPGSWQLAWVNQETPALPQAALEYVIDGDREYRQLEA